MTNPTGRLLYALVIAVLLAGCNIRRTEPKDPEFAKDHAAMSGELHALVSC